MRLSSVIRGLLEKYSVGLFILESVVSGLAVCNEIGG